MKRFSLVVFTLCWLCSWSLMRSILVGPSLPIAAEQADLLDINTATAEQLKALHLTRAAELGVRLLKEQMERSHMGVKRTGMRGTD